MKQIEAQKKEDRLTTSQELTVKELEESSDDNAVAVSWFGSHEPSMSEAIEIEELIPAISGDRHQVAASGDRYRIAQEPGASEEHRQIAQGPAVSEDCHQVA